MLTFCFGNNARVSVKLQEHYSGLVCPSPSFPARQRLTHSRHKGGLQIPSKAVSRLRRGGYARERGCRKGELYLVPRGKVFREGQPVPGFRAGSVQSGGCGWRLRCEGTPGEARGGKGSSPRATLSKQLGLDRTGGATLGGFSRPSPAPRVCCLHSQRVERERAGCGRRCASEETRRTHREARCVGPALGWGHVLAGAGLGFLVIVEAVTLSPEGFTGHWRAQAVLPLLQAIPSSST